MLDLSLGLLLIAGLVGGILAALHLRSRGGPAAWPLRGLHALLGSSGLAVLLLALDGPPRGAALGVTGFDRIAAGLLVLAVGTGIAVLSIGPRRRNGRGLLIGVHATAAISGIVMLAAYTLAG